MHHEEAHGSAAPGGGKVNSLRSEPVLLFLFRRFRFVGCWFLEEFRIERRIDLDLLEFRGTGLLAILLVFVLVRHREAVGCPPIGEITLAIEWTGLSGGFVLLAQDVA